MKSLWAALPVLLLYVVGLSLIVLGIVYFSASTHADVSEEADNARMAAIVYLLLGSGFLVVGAVMAFIGIQLKRLAPRE